MTEGRTDPMTDKLISIEGITKRFTAPGGGSTIVFDDLWLSMARGEFVCIIGHSGCGKTTVLNILAGLDVPSAGAVIVDNEAIEGPSLDRAVIFQSHALLPWLTVMGNVSPSSLPGLIRHPIPFSQEDGCAGQARA